MPMPRLIAGTLLAAMAIAGTPMVCGQGYPDRPIRIVTGGVGASGDFTSRLIAHGLTGVMGQPMIVDNRGAGIAPGDIVAKASADGHTLLVVGDNFWVGPLLQKTPYDPVRDFSQVTLAAKALNVLTVYPLLPAKSVPEFRPWPLPASRDTKP